MTVRRLLSDLSDIEILNFWLTNYIPRRLATRFVGWLARIEQPLVRDASIAVWRQFSNLDLSEAKETRFKSLRDCFIRELKEGARPVNTDTGTLVSPCDAIVGACGQVEEGMLLQVKGFPYGLDELVCDSSLAARYIRGCYATLRLTASMYHRFHAPYDCRIGHVTHVSGDTWNVNPPTLRRIPKVFCRNERAVVHARLDAHDDTILLIPVAAILVAGLRLRFLDVAFDRDKREPSQFTCDASFKKGDEMGWFEHGSTIIVIAPEGFSLAPDVAEGASIRMGQALLNLPT
jgi:phosphatidylserine decarboxylase